MTYCFGPALCLYYDPLQSSSRKALMALYESGVPFDAEIVHSLDRYAGAAFLAMSPDRTTPVLRDRRAYRTLHGLAPIIEYVALEYPSAAGLLPESELERAEARRWERIFESIFEAPASVIDSERSMPESRRDRQRITSARAALKAAYGMLERHLLDGRGATAVVLDSSALARNASVSPWLAGEFSVADCAAGVALLHASSAEPFTSTHLALADYFDRLSQRASFRQLLSDMRPWSGAVELRAPRVEIPLGAGERIAARSTAG